MKPWVVLVVIGIVLLLATVREGFGETTKIKNPAKWTTNDIEAIKSLVSPKSGLTEQEVRDVVGGFWSYTIPSRLPGETGQARGWAAATRAITVTEITQYLDSVVQGNRAAYETKRADFLDLLKAYYIDQGQDVFQAASGYTPTPDSDAAPASETPAVTRARPNTTDETLRREVAGYMGIPRNSPDIDTYIGKIQIFYDTVYLPNKEAPTLETIRGFVANQTDVDKTKRPGLESSIDYWFTQSPTNLDLVTGEKDQAYWNSRPKAPAPAPAAKAPPSESSTLYGPSSTMPGTNLFGPQFAGYGSSAADQNSTGGSSTKNFPALMGGFTLPSTDSLGVNARNNYFPWSRPAADITQGPPQWMQGNVANSVSAASYSGRSKTDPVGYLNDFSSFFR